MVTTNNNVCQIDYIMSNIYYYTYMYTYNIYNTCILYKSITFINYSSVADTYRIILKLHFISL